MNINECGG